MIAIRDQRSKRDGEGETIADLARRKIVSLSPRVFAVLGPNELIRDYGYNEEGRGGRRGGRGRQRGGFVLGRAWLCYNRDDIGGRGGPARLINRESDSVERGGGEGGVTPGGRGDKLRAYAELRSWRSVRYEPAGRSRRRAEGERRRH